VEALALIIPARMGATRLPHKPLAEIGDLPLVVRTAQLGLKFLNSLPQNKYKTVLAVATDHQDIFDVCQQHGITAVMTDPDLPSGSDRVLAAADILQQDQGFEADLLLNLQGDEPFLPLDCLNAILALVAQQPQGDLYTAATQYDAAKHTSLFEDPNAVKVVCDQRQAALYFSRSPIPHPRDGQTAFTFLKHLGVYLWRKDALRQFVANPPTPLEQIEKLEQLRAIHFGLKIMVAQGNWHSIDINTRSDLQQAENHLNRIQDHQE